MRPSIACHGNHNSRLHRRGRDFGFINRSTGLLPFPIARSEELNAIKSMTTQPLRHRIRKGTSLALTIQDDLCARRQLLDERVLLGKSRINRQIECTRNVAMLIVPLKSSVDPNGRFLRLNSLVPTMQRNRLF